ncbi:MAG: PHB depolymerase family esterase [Herminiimonas sp.]|nr:PHB depolymerase family esterase [Herminiimonas sp.]
MLKAFGKLWLKSAQRLAKAQVVQQKKLQKKLLKTLLPAVTKPHAAPARRSAATKKAVTRPAGSSASHRPPTGARHRSAAATALHGATGTRLNSGGDWSRAYYISPLADSRGRHRRMTYWLFVPHIPDTGPVMSASVQADGVGNRTTAPQLPLVVMLHGCDQTAEDFANGTRMNRLAALHGFAVLYPQQSATAHAQRCWPWYERSLQEGGDEVALVAGLLEKVIARNGFDRTRVYVAGMSAGAALAQTLALHHPDVFAAVGSHSGPVYGVAESRLGAFAVMQAGSRDAARAASQLLIDRPDFPVMPILILQGEQDPVVRPVNAGQLARQFCILNQLAPDAHEPVVLRKARAANDAWCRTDYRRQGRVVVRLCEVAHLAHAWSGGDASLRYNAARGPDASALLWDFFKRQRRR